MEHHGQNVTLPEFVAWVNFSTPAEPLSYVWQEQHQSILILHILLMLIGTLFVLAAALFLKSSKYRSLLWSLSSFVLLLGTAASALHRAKTQDLYKNALHRKFGFFLVAIVLFCTLWTILSQIRNKITPPDGREFSRLPQSEAGVLSGESVEARPASLEDDSARSSETLFRRQMNSSQQRDSFDELLNREIHFKQTQEERSVFVTARRRLSAFAPAILLTLVYAQILMGIATYCGLFTNHEIFNGLAHWIKSSVFFLFGIWVFVRYLGGFSAIGHAWNDTSSSNVSAECIECGLIFTYGTIDLFLERLGHSSEPISHTDIQHMSIAAMFAFAGFVGLLLESRRIQALLSAVVRGDSGPPDKRQMSMNVMPSLVVFFTGMLMSVHKQDTQFASDVHAVWGYYFCVASVLRVLTYMLIYLTSSRSTRNINPARPPTEALVAFCLIAGSIAFSFSARDPVQVFEYYGIDLMFIVSLTVAGSLGVLVWVMYVMVLVGLEKHKYLR